MNWNDNSSHKIRIIILVLFISMNTPSLFGQEEKWSANIGLGNIESINAGVEFYFSKRNSVALTLGVRKKTETYSYFSSVYFSSESEFYKYSIMLNHQLYLGFSRKDNSLPTWYIGDRIGYVYSSFAEINRPSTIAKNGYLDFVVVAGRKFFFTPKFGLNLDAGAGVGILLMEHVPNNRVSHYDSPDFLIEMRIQLFYRF